MSQHGREGFKLIGLFISSMKAEAVCEKVDVKGTFYIARDRLTASMHFLAMGLLLQ